MYIHVLWRENVVPDVVMCKGILLLKIIMINLIYSVSTE